LSKLNKNDDSGLFATTYADARALFLAAAGAAGATLTAYVHPTARGPNDGLGGQLSIDVAVVGASKAQRALVVVCGTHGPEGYLGSAAQLALLEDLRLSGPPPDTRIVFIHGLNPYGFAWWSRTTENNVDLNRNFIDYSLPLGRNEAYAELHAVLCPSDWTPVTQAAGHAANAAWIAKHGFPAWLDGISRGQYDEPTGLSFGGVAPEWSSTTLEEIVDRHLQGVDRVGLIEWHTGLGDYGEPFFLCFNEPDGALWQRCADWWGRARLEDQGGFGGGVRPEYTGLVFHGLQRFLAPAEMAGAVIEFGTGPIDNMFDWLRIDRWVRFGADDGQREARRQGVRDAFCPPDPAWRSGVIASAREIQRMALKGVAAW